jgi:hypothetical protein
MNEGEAPPQRCGSADETLGGWPGDLAEAQEDPQASQHPLFWRKVAEGYKNIRQDNTHGIPRRCSLPVLIICYGWAEGAISFHQQVLCKAHQ